MKVQKVCLREIRMKLPAPFETSFGATEERRIALVEVEVTGEGGRARGWGEVTAGNDPFYSPETIDTAWDVLRDFVWPAVREWEFQSAAEIEARLAHIRGHNMAKAGLETAVWDAEARLKNLPLWKLLGGAREEIPCGVSLGIQPRIEELLAAIEKELAAGYQRIKIKIKPGKDVQLAEAVRGRFPKIKLMVDANSAYTLDDAGLLKQLDRFYLMMIEQPLGWDDLYSHVALQRQIETPVCLDECIHSLGHARAAIEMGACRIINIKLGRVGGHSVARKMQQLCLESGVPVWCGGMLEAGIGRAHNIAMSTLPGFTLPGDVSASRRYWAEDIIEPEVEVSPRGTIRAPGGPGIGFEPRRELIERLTLRREELS
jgi:O-succinylbenzoate synthase